MMAVRKYFRTGKHSARARRRAKARAEKALINEGYAAILTAGDLRRAGKPNAAQEMDRHAARITEQLTGLWARHG